MAALSPIPESSVSAPLLPSRATAAGELVAFGIVYGDIGISPLYAVRGVFENRPVTEDVVLGAVQCRPLSGP